MVADDGREVTFRVKDHRAGKRTTETVSGAEFVRRFCLHIMPFRMPRVRYAGIFANGQRKKRLEECRKLLGQPPPEEVADDSAFDDDDPDVIGKPSGLTCFQCGGPMRQSGELDARTTLAILARIAALAGSTAMLAEEAANLLPQELNYIFGRSNTSPLTRNPTATPSPPPTTQPQPTCIPTLATAAQPRPP